MRAPKRRPTETLAEAGIVRTYDTEKSPNAFVVIEFTPQGPRSIGNFLTESDARTAYDGVDHAYIAAQFQTDPTRGASAGQTTIWACHK